MATKGRVNLLPLINQLTIVRKNLGTAKFADVINWAQLEVVKTVEDQLSAGKPVRIIVLKARQIGISTIIEAIAFVLAMVLRNLRVLVVAHELDASEHLLSITRTYWDTYPLRAAYTPQHLSTKKLGWKETNSRIQITTAKNVASGRSRTIHFLHGSEVAYWPDPETLMGGLDESIPDVGMSVVFLESTANGVGDLFQETWEAAESGDSAYIPLFFPWYKHPEYKASELGLDYSEATMLPLDEEEEKLHKTYGITLDRLAWRRWKIREMSRGRHESEGSVRSALELFHQEYPTTPEEAFLSTGTNVFALPLLRKVYQPRHGKKGRLVQEGNRVRFQPAIDGPLTIFKYPADDDFGCYMVAGDPTRTVRGDPACIQVLNRRTWEQVAVWRGKIDPASFATPIAQLGRYYNNAVVNTEIEGPGYATIGALLQMDYPYIWKHQWADKAPGKEADTYGWSTSHKRKQWLVGNLLRSVVDQDIVIHDATTFFEMKNFVVLPNGEYGPNTPNGHDDTVMALGICLTSIITTAAELIPYGGGEGPEVVHAGVGEQRPPWEDWEEIA